ncbi:YveK family protein [Bacillus sp. FJAT-45066]|uniref:YveK family protein n=1 Tax=Bacillus sp. FJAT-45066 TaxID=2011010 RepID=UPI000BB8A3C6|nr:Wzz/FepE/Etk N-terminal domain-containing protein [Bacillus sp. FJAT-45066]
MEETISLKELFQTIRKRLSLIMLITIIATTVSGMVSFFVLTPIYQSSTQILVNQSKNETGQYSSADIQSNLQLINTYNEIIKSPAILSIVSEQVGGGETAVSLNSKVTVSSANNSQVVNIRVEHEDPAMAALIANATATVFQREIISLMNVDNVNILSEATASTSPVKPNPQLNMAIALVVGLMAGVGLAFLLEFLDNTVKSEQDVENQLGLPVLGVITVISEDELAEVAKEARKSRLRGEKSA